MPLSEELNTEAVAEIVSTLGLSPHPEGGWYKRTFTHPVSQNGRALGSAVIYLMTADFQPVWHRIDAEELWHHYAGAPATIWTGSSPEAAIAHRLGSDFSDNQTPQIHVPATSWQRARTDGPWSLVGCTVVPEFAFQKLDFYDPKNS